jgi:hypothetical protein
MPYHSSKPWSVGSRPSLSPTCHLPKAPVASPASENSSPRVYFPGGEPVVALARQGHAAVAGPDGQPAAQDGRAGRGALGLDVVVLEPHPLAGQGIDAWGGHHTAIAADVPPADVINQDEDHIGPIRTRLVVRVSHCGSLSTGGCVGPPTAANLTVLCSPLSSFTGERASHTECEPGNQASSLPGLHPCPDRAGGGAEAANNGALVQTSASRTRRS